MSDFDTRRIGEIHALEERINALQAELTTKKNAANKWEPRISSSMDSATQTAKVTMQFGGKVFAAQMTQQALQDGTLTGMTSSVIETLLVHLIGPQLRQVVEPEIERLIAAAKSAKGAGKW